MFGNKHQWSLVLKSFKHLLSLQISFLFIVNSQSLHYMPNQTLFYQRQVIWIIKQCFLMWNKLHYSYKQNKCFEDWFSKTLKLKFEPFLINKTPLHISNKTQKKKFQLLWKHIHGNLLNSFQNKFAWNWHQNGFYVWNGFEVPKLSNKMILVNNQPRPTWLHP
jgi:hypothetical protein